MKLYDLCELTDEECPITAQCPITAISSTTTTLAQTDNRILGWVKSNLSWTK